MPADQPAIVARRRARQAFDTCGIRPGVGVTRYLALAGHFCYRGDRFVADNEIAFDVWMHYPDVVNPEPRERTADAE